MKTGNNHVHAYRGYYTAVITALITLWGCSKKSPTLAPLAPQDTPWTWTEIHSGGLEPWALDVDPKNGSVIYVASSLDSGGIWKSTDGGGSFTKVWAEGAWDVTVDPNNRNVVYLARNGVLRSRDGGGTWSRLNNLNAWYVQPDRFDSSYIFAGGYRSTDYGATWQIMNPSYEITDLVQSRLNPNLLYLARTMSGGVGIVFQSTDRGVTWLPLNAYGSFDRLSIDPLDDQRLYIITSHWSSEDSLRRTSDGGTTWEAFPVGQNTRYYGVAPVVVDTRLGLGQVLYAGGQGVHRSFDYGKTWRTIGLEGVCVKDIEVDPTAPTNTTVLYVTAPRWGNPGYCDRVYRGAPGN